MRKVIIAALTLAVAVGASAQQPKKTAQTTATAPAPASDPVVIKFGSTEVRQSEFEAAIQTLPEEYQAMASGPAKRNFAEDYARMKMLASEAVKNGLDKDKKVQMQLALMRAEILVSTGRYDAARDAFMKALVAAPNNGWALWGLARAERRLGNRVAALAAERALERTWMGEDDWLRMDRL